MVILGQKFACPNSIINNIRLIHTMGRIICIGNHKGGVGKTTTVVNLAMAFAIAEKKTLIIDADPQGHSTSGMGIDKTKINKSLYDGLKGIASVDEIIFNGEVGFLKIIPSRLELIRIEMEFVSKSVKETILKDLIKTQKGSYDYILIDCPPSMNLLTVNALCASDSLLIPVQCEFFAWEGLSQFLKIYSVFKKVFNPNMRIEGILLTMVDEDDEPSRQIAQEIGSKFNGMVFKTFIPRDKQFYSSSHPEKSLLLRDITSPGARSYLELAQEIMSRESNKGALE
jgi:chromosome partitioning protein